MLNSDIIAESIWRKTKDSKEAWRVEGVTKGFEQWSRWKHLEKHMSAICILTRILAGHLDLTDAYKAKLLLVLR